MSERRPFEDVMPEGKGHLVGLEKGFYEALQADRELQARKFGNRKKRKGRARYKKTISPKAPPYPVEVEQNDPAAGAGVRTPDPIAATDPLLVEPSASTRGRLPDVDVEHRSMDIYAHLSGQVATDLCPSLGGEVCYG